MPIRALWIAAALAIMLGALWLWLPWAAITQWAASEQRGFQNAMARALRGIQAGDPLALWALCTATAAYGFVHALGPGHGKVLIGGAALASGASLRRLAMLTLVSSMAQAGTAIALVGGIVLLLSIGSQQLVTLTERWLAPASYGAIALIGVMLVWRGMRAWRPTPAGHLDCGHAHGPNAGDVSSLTTPRETVALVASIAIRPCTGALFVLVIAARFGAFWAGALAVVAMGLGTAAFNLMVAGSGFAARHLARVGAGDGQGFGVLSAALHIIGGVLIVVISVAMMLPYLP